MSHHVVGSHGRAQGSLRLKKSLRLRHALFLFAVAGIFFGPLAHAATAPYQAKAHTYTVDLTAGQARKITLVFSNVGLKSWTSRKEATALYLNGNSSLLGHSTWLQDDLPALLNEREVKPGQRATVTFWVNAPRTPGTYRERFLLSAGPHQWIKGSMTHMTFNVAGSQNATKDPSPASSVTRVAPVRLSPPTDSPSRSVGGATLDVYKAELVDRGGIEWQLEPQGHAIVKLAFKNTGTAAWTHEKKTPVILLSNRKRHPFKDSSWKSDAHAADLAEVRISPGEVGHFHLELRGAELPGMYQETFQLAVGGNFISGGSVTLPIRVTTPREYIVKGIVNGVNPELVENALSSSTNLAASGRYKALLLLRSTNEIMLLGNGRVALTYGFKNVGRMTWESISLRVASVTPALGSQLSRVRDESWLSATEAARASKTTVPGEIGFIGFTIQAPPKKGNYTARFQLYADGQPIEDGTIDIPITVTADGYIEPETTALTPVPISNTQASNSTPTLNPVPLTGDSSSLPNEPIIRVGLFATTDNQMVARGVSSGLNLLESGNILCRFEAGERVTVSYDRTAGISRASGPRCASQATGVYVVVAPDGISPIELVDFSRPVSWLPGANDNTFRGKLELRYAKTTDSVWIINELPIEWYLKGIAETSNSSPQEYQRALLTAARTYAMYHVQRGTKHADENYTVDAKYDQVYRGYGAEARDLNVVAAVDATRGQIVTYDGKLALTPYYSRSDGRTRSWTEVWGGGPYAWLVSVSVPWDNGRTLWGHGVGLSATGALGMAKEGKTYDEILRYFYTGTELRRAYK